MQISTHLRTKLKESPATLEGFRTSSILEFRKTDRNHLRTLTYAMLVARRLLRHSALVRSYAGHASGYGDPDQTGYGTSQKGQSRRTRELEHPGAPPIDQGKGPGTGGFGGTDRAETGGGDRHPDGGRPQPKINPVSEPGGHGDQEVAKHNKEMDERYDHQKADQATGDEVVGKGFWQGEAPPSACISTVPFARLTGLATRCVRPRPRHLVIWR
jgi:hypothetical protein